MKVTFTQSGGFAGLTKQCALDTAQLGPEQGNELESLVSQSGVLDRPKGPSTAAATGGQGHADGRGYEVVVEDAGRLTHVRLSDSDLGGRTGELIAFLRARAKPVRPT
jgi:hypothetical protein